MKVFNQGMRPPWAAFLILILSCLLPSSGQSSQPPDKSFDGPAELPREHVKSALKDTPAQGKTWAVQSGQNLEAVLANAACGDVIQLQAGATFGNSVIPAKSCDDSHWIIIRSSAPDASLPPEGKRLTPCYAGISSAMSRT